MGKFFIMYGLEFLLGLTLLTQVVIPMFMPNLKYFWLFKSSDKKTGDTTLDQLREKAAKNKEERLNISGSVSTIEEVIKETKNHIE